MTPAPDHIALVDDDPDILTLLGSYLAARGYRVTPLRSGRELMALMPADPPTLVLLDLGLPGEDGFAIARQLREHWRCGLVIVTGRGDLVDKVVGLEIGADDYVTKPFDLRELLARVKAVLRRVVPRSAPVPSAPAPVPSAEVLPAASATFAANPVLTSPPRAERWAFDGWTLDTAARRLGNPQGAEVPLTTGEFDLLCALVRHAGRVLSRDFLLEHTRGRSAGPFDRTIDTQVARLRKKIEADADGPQLIKSVRGAGYVFVPAVTSLPAVGRAFT